MSRSSVQGAPDNSPDSVARSDKNLPSFRDNQLADRLLNERRYRSPVAKVLGGSGRDLIVEQFDSWCGFNAKKQQTVVDGHYWTYGTYAYYAEKMDVPQGTLRRKIGALEDLGVIVSARYGRGGDTPSGTASTTTSSSSSY